MLTCSLDHSLLMYNVVCCCYCSGKGSVIT